MGISNHSSDEELRGIIICVDCRKLNLVTKKMPYYMPTLEEITDRVGQNSAISNVDLTKGFHQIPVAKEDRAKTAFVCPMGKFQYRCMPFGLMRLHVFSK